MLRKEYLSIDDLEFVWLHFPATKDWEVEEDEDYILVPVDKWAIEDVLREFVSWVIPGIPYAIMDAKYLPGLMLAIALQMPTYFFYSFGDGTLYLKVPRTSPLWGYYIKENASPEEVHEGWASILADYLASRTTEFFDIFFNEIIPTDEGGELI